MLADLRAAFAFLTVLPVGYSVGRKPGYAFAYFPLVGLVIGAILWLLGVQPFFSTDVRSLLILFAWVILTGGLHLDGFGDACDALLATTTPEKRLEIMKDPRAGAWAVIGLVLLLLGKWVMVREISPLGLLAPPVVARWAMVGAAVQFPYARSTGLGACVREGLGRPQLITASLITGMTFVIIAWLIDWRLLALLLAPVLTVFVFGAWAARRLGGGLTGDVYGAICELTELLGLFVLLLMAR
jgi:adenosylcobinamide-GDP ribazoletransferase